MLMQRYVFSFPVVEWIIENFVVFPYIPSTGRRSSRDWFLGGFCDHKVMKKMYTKRVYVTKQRHFKNCHTAGRYNVVCFENNWQSLKIIV